MNIIQEKENAICRHHKSGVSVENISALFGRNYSSRVVAGIIAKSEITIERKEESFLVVPSKMNYEHKMVRDYGTNDSHS